ncbi:hypothetical protein F511_20050 [Dorcoceras hygrometricum]|uniref:Uncharacterized protein n=1 Tax=Dorcoceras hygrometricum TaxID=472368 RepID=A0A2Z7DAZ9_9LAMI|nr:hypothetical protein F511_20050 [Dorcoceras hygrometricum]
MCLSLSLAPSDHTSTVHRELFRRIPGVSDGCFARARLLPESSGFLAVLIVAQYKILLAQITQQELPGLLKSKSSKETAADSAQLNQQFTNEQGIRDFSTRRS